MQPVLAQFCPRDWKSPIMGRNDNFRNVSWIYYLLYLEHIGFRRPDPKKRQKSDRPSGGVPEATCGDFWWILGSIWEALGVHFRHFGRHFGGSKKESKKRCEKVQKYAPRWTARRNARVPGEDLGGVKTQQKGEEQQGAEQRRGGDHRTLPSDLTRSLPPSPGGGRI